MSDKKNNTEIGFIHLADYAFSGDGNKLSKLNVIGIFDKINASKFPVIHPEIFIVVNIKGLPESEHEIQFDIKNSEGNSLFSTNPPPPVKIKLSEFGMGNIIQRLLGVKFEQAGAHKVLVMADGQEAGEINLEIIDTTVAKNGRAWTTSC